MTQQTAQLPLSLPIPIAPPMVDYAQHAYGPVEYSIHWPIGLLSVTLLHFLVCCF